MEVESCVESGVNSGVEFGVDSGVNSGVESQVESRFIQIDLVAIPNSTRAKPRAEASVDYIITIIKLHLTPEAQDYLVQAEI